MKKRSARIVLKTSKKKLEILRGASDAFRRFGFEQTGTREIAETIGMTPGSLYYYFKNKGEIIAYCQETALARLLAEDRRILRLRDRADHKLQLLIEAQLRLMLEDLYSSAGHIEFRNVPKRMLRRILEKRSAHESLVRRLIRKGIEQRLFQKVDVRLSALAILGALNWTVQWYTPEGPSNPQEIAREFSNLFVNGLLRRRPSARNKGRRPGRKSR